MSFKIPIRPDLKKHIHTIGLRNVSLGHEGSATIISDVSVEFNLGKIVWVTGASGSGKSTLLKTFAGLILPQQGQLYINEKDVVSDMSFEEFMPYRLNIGYSFELGGLLNNRTIWDNLMLPLLYHKAAGYRDSEKRAEEILKMFAIEKYKNERPASVPGGVRKAACVARAFMMDPQILILDEPTTGLNEEGLGALMFLLRDRISTSLTIITSRVNSSMEAIAHEELILNHEGVKTRIINKLDRTVSKIAPTASKITGEAV